MGDSANSDGSAEKGRLFMMRIFGFILGFILIVAISCGILIAVAFNPNLYRGEIESYLSETTGMDVSLGEISIQWGVPLRLGIDALKVEDIRQGEVIVKSSKVRVGINWPALLRKQLVIQSFKINHPMINIVRQPNGVWNWQKIIQEASPTSPGAQKQSPNVNQNQPIPVEMPKPKSDDDWAVVITKFEINDGHIHFRDESIRPSFEFDVRRINARVKQSKKNAPIQLLLEASLFNSQDLNLWLKAEYFEADKILFKLTYEKDILEVEGRLSDLNQTPRFAGKLFIRQLDLEEITPDNFKNREYISGKLTAQFEGSAVGTHPNILTQSLSLQGAADIRDGAFKNINIVRKIMDAVPQIPGISPESALEERLPENLRPLLEGRDTPFEILKTTLSVGQGRASAPEIQLQHQEYLFQAQGEYGLNQQDLNAQGQIFLLDGLTEFFVSKVNELETLKNAQGRLGFPFRVFGIVPNIQVQPDLTAIAGQLLSTRGQELISKGLEKLAKYLE